MTSTLVDSLHAMLDSKPASPKSQLTLGTPLQDDEDWYGYGNWSRGYTGGNRRPAGFVGSYNPKPTRKVAVVHPDGTEEPFTIPYDCDGWFDLAATVWPVTDHVMRVPVAHCSFTHRDPTFNACVYQATDSYLQARWGRRLDESDRRWLAAHPLATDGGIPQEYTATCIDQLVTPYGLRVSRVRIRKGSLVLGDSVMAWIQALGCNPFALADRSTSNAEAAARMGLPVEQADALWRVEFSDDPLPCSIIGERGWSNSNATGVSVGSMGGHARYLAPRGIAGDWFISVQLDLAVSYLVPPPNPEYVPRKGPATLLVGSITGPDGKVIAERVGTTWKRLDAPVVSAVVSAAPPSTSSLIEPVDLQETDAEFCALCGDTNLQSQELMPDAYVCRECVDRSWTDYRCPHCKITYGSEQQRYPVLPELIAHTDDEYEWLCPKCRGTFIVTAEDAKDPEHRHLVDLSEAVTNFPREAPLPANLLRSDDPWDQWYD